MSPYAKFGLDRPSHSAGHRPQTNRHNAFYYVDKQKLAARNLLLFCGFRWDDNNQQSGCERFLHLSHDGWDLWTSTWLHLHAVGLQSMDRLHADHLQSHVSSTTASRCFHRDSYFPVLEQLTQNCWTWGCCRELGVVSPKNMWVDSS